MRANEFATLVTFIEESRSWYDKWMDTYIQNGIITREQIFLTEIFENNKERFNQVNDFIANQMNSSVTPVRGGYYGIVGVVFNSPLRRLQILSCETEVELVNVAHDYVVRCNEKLHTFPHEFNNNTSMGATFFYNTIEEATQMESMIVLTLSMPEWLTEHIVITTDGNRIVK